MIFVAFKSRQDAVAFARAMGKADKKIISTPNDIANGCGLSVLLENKYIGLVKTVLSNGGFGSFIGTFRR